MAKIEVDEAEYNRMVALQGVASKIVGNPAARKMLEQAHKLVDPNAPTPMIDQEAAQLAPIKETETRLSAEIAALKKEREDEKREQTLASIGRRQDEGFARLRKQHGFLDEGIEKIKKIMEDKGLLDVDDAHAIFMRDNPPQMPVNPGAGITGERWNFAETNADSDKDIAALISGKGDGSTADAAAMRMANQALQELRGSRR